MSSAVTDTVIAKQIAKLLEILEQVDQLAADAADCDDIAPGLSRYLAVGTYLCEKELHEAEGRYSCGHDQLIKNCSCCFFIRSIQAKGDLILKAHQW